MEFLRQKNLKPNLKPNRIFGLRDIPTFSVITLVFLKNTKTALTSERIELESCVRALSIRFEIFYKTCASGTF